MELDELAGIHARTERGTEELARRRAGGDEGVLVDRASALTQGALDAKTKEMIAIAISVASGATTASPSTSRPRSSAARRREEILETLGMAIYMGAGPSAMYASHALGAYTAVRGRKGQVACRTEPGCSRNLFRDRPGPDPGVDLEDFEQAVNAGEVRGRRRA